MNMRSILILGFSAMLLAGCAPVSSGPVANFESVILGGAQAPAQTPSSPDSPSENPSPEILLDTEWAVDEIAEIEIEDQSGDGKAVAIEELRVGREGVFLVIYDSTSLVLAAVPVSPKSQPVTVSLSPELTKSQELEAVLYLDNGDSIFDLSSDVPIVDDEGELVHEDFEYEFVTSG
jgi:hypothetical protein